MNRRQFIKTSAAAGLASASHPVLSKQASPTRRNVLVLGGTGFFGPVIVDELLAQGHAVTLFNRGKSNPHLFPNLPRIIGDRETADGAGLVNLVADKQRWDWVVDTWQGSSKAVIDTATLLADRTEQYQYVSTVSVYDKWDKIGIDENEPLNPLPSEREEIISPNRYALRKTFAELALREIMPNRSVCFRSHGMRGHRTTAPRHEPYWQVKVARGGDLVVPADTGHYQVTDMVSLSRFMVHCGTKGINGEFNVAYSPFLFKDFIEHMVSELNSNVKLHWIPQQFLVDNDVKIMRTTPAGRYRFDITRAHDAGLVNRPFEELLQDQLQGYELRNPNGDFQFGKPDTRTISTNREREIIRLWQIHQGTYFSESTKAKQIITSGYS